MHTLLLDQWLPVFATVAHLSKTDLLAHLGLTWSGFSFQGRQPLIRAKVPVGSEHLLFCLHRVSSFSV